MSPSDSGEEPCSQDATRSYLLFGMFYLNIVLLFVSVTLFVSLKSAVTKPHLSKSNQTDTEDPIRVVIAPNDTINILKSID